MSYYRRVHAFLLYIIYALSGIILNPVLGSLRPRNGFALGSVSLWRGRPDYPPALHGVQKLCVRKLRRSAATRGKFSRSFDQP